MRGNGSFRLNILEEIKSKYNFLVGLNISGRNRKIQIIVCFARLHIIYIHARTHAIRQHLLRRQRS